MEPPFFWLGADAETILHDLETYEITGNQFLDGAVFFVPEIDLTDAQSGE